MRQAACHPGLIDVKRSGESSAKLETLIATKALARKVGDIALDPARPIQYVRGNNLTNSGPEHLFVKFRGLSA